MSIVWVRWYCFGTKLKKPFLGEQNNGLSVTDQEMGWRDNGNCPAAGGPGNCRRNPVRCTSRLCRRRGR